MSMKNNELIEYIRKTKSLVLGTVTEKNKPALRSIGSFGTDGTFIYFSTGAATSKVQQIASNPNVSLLFQHENQQFPAFRNVSVAGKAERLTEAADKKAAVNFITARNPAFSKRIAQNGLDTFALYKVTPIEIKLLDFGKGSSNNIEIHQSLIGR